MLLNWFRADFVSLVWNFCRWVADIPPSKMSPSRDERGETSVCAGYCFGMTGENNIVDSNGNESIPANFFWDISVRFLSWKCWDFWRRHDHFRRFPKKSEVVRRSPKSSEDVRSLPKAKLSRKRLSTKSEIARKVLSFIHFTHGFRSLHGSELTYFWKLCQARWQQLTFFNQAWEIGPQAWAGVRSKFSTCRRETHA